MEQFVLRKIILKLKNLKNYKKKKIAVMGLTYKSNVPDYRNSLAVNIYYKLKRMNKNIRAYDPIIEDSFVKKNNINTNFKEIMKSEIFIILVKHEQIGEAIKVAKKNKKIIIDPLSLI